MPYRDLFEMMEKEKSHNITCKELYKIEYPEVDEYDLLHNSCPNNYDYLIDFCCPTGIVYNEEECKKCWDREVTNKEKLAEVLAKHKLSQENVDYETELLCPFDEDHWDKKLTIKEKLEMVLDKHELSQACDDILKDVKDLRESKSETLISWGDRIAENLNLEKSKVDDLAETVENLYNGEVSSESVKEAALYIKDSGERREFETGAVRDIQEGKGRCDLSPLDVIAGWFKHSYTYDERVQNVFRNIERFKETGSVDYLYEVLSYGNTMFVNSETMFLEVAKHFEAGAVKYGENNWQKGIPVHCYIDSAVRHYLKFLRGDDDEPHDRAFVWNIMCCIWTCVHKPELNDFCEVSDENK